MLLRQNGVRRTTLLVLGGGLALASSVVAGECTELQAEGGDFGAVNPVSPVPVREIGAFQVRCKNDYRLSLDAGLYFQQARRVRDGRTGHFISYALWQDPAMSRAWGDNGVSAGNYPAASMYAAGNGSLVHHRLFGSVLNQESPPGEYRDIVHVTLSYPPYQADDRLETDIILKFRREGSCQVDANGITGFGTWPIGGSNVTDVTGVALGVVSVTCPQGVTYAVGMDAGGYWHQGSRHLRNGADTISYVLWTDSARRREWGDMGLSAIEPAYVETYPAPAVQSKGTGQSQAFFVWGDVALRHAEKAGIYRDKVTVTVVWP